MDVARLAYVDDTTLAFADRKSMEKHLKNWITHNGKFSQQIHVGTATKKSKSTCVLFAARDRDTTPEYRQARDDTNIQINQLQHIHFAKHQKHLGTIYDSELKFSKHHLVLLGSLASKFNALKKTLWKNPALKHEIELKRKFYEAHFVPCLTFNSEGLPMDTSEWKALNNFHNNCVKTIAGTSWQFQSENGITNRQLREQTGIGTLRHYYDKTYINSFSRWLNKENSIAGMALTAFLQHNNPTMTSHMAEKNDPAIARNICCFQRIAGYIDRFGKEEYNIYTPHPDNDADEHTRVMETMAKQTLMEAFTKGLCGNKVKIKDNSVTPNSKIWTQIEIAKCKVLIKVLEKTMNVESLEFVFKLSMKMGTKSVAQIKTFLSHGKIETAKPPAPKHVSSSSSSSSSSNNSSSSSSSSSTSNTNGGDVPTPATMSTTTTSTPRWTWQSALKNKSIMKILKTVLETAKFEDYDVKLSYGNGNMKKYEFNGIR